MEIKLVEIFSKYNFSEDEQEEVRSLIKKEYKKGLNTGLDLAVEIMQSQLELRKEVEA